MITKFKTIAASVVIASAFASAFASAAEYVVGTGATYRPFEYETPNKELVGFDVDLMNLSSRPLVMSTVYSRREPCALSAA